MWTRRRTVTVSGTDLHERGSREPEGSVGTLTDEVLEHPARHRIRLATQLADDMHQTGGRHSSDHG